MYNFCGPDTRLVSRLKRGDPPLDPVDAVCKQHDIDYAKAENVEDVMSADKKMISKLGGVRGHTMMKNIIKTGMQAKQLAHKVGLPKNSFTGRNILQNSKDLQDTNEAKQAREELQKMGYGYGIIQQDYKGGGLKPKKRYQKSKLKIQTKKPKRKIKTAQAVKLNLTDLPTKNEIKKQFKEKDPLDRLRKNLKNVIIV